MDEIVQLLRQANGLLQRAERIASERANPQAAAQGSVRAQGDWGFFDPDSPASWLREYRFLRAVEKEGPGGLDVDRQRELMIAAGYRDTRASGGFFSGGTPSLRRDPDTDRRYITDAGLRRVQEGVLRFGGAEVDRLESPLANATG